MLFAAIQNRSPAAEIGKGFTKFLIFCCPAHGSEVFCSAAASSNSCKKSLINNVVKCKYGFIKVFFSTRARKNFFFFNQYLRLVVLCVVLLIMILEEVLEALKYEDIDKICVKKEQKFFSGRNDSKKMK